MPRQYLRLFATPAVFLVSWVLFVLLAWSLGQGADGVSRARAVVYAVPAALLHGSVVLLHHNRWWHLAWRRIVIASIAAGLASALSLFLVLEHWRELMEAPLPSFGLLVGGLVFTSLAMTLLSASVLRTPGRTDAPPRR